MRFPRRSFLFSIAVTFAIGYAVSSIAHFFLVNAGDYDEWNRQRAAGVVSELKLGLTLLKHSEIEVLRSRLADLRADRAIDFYLLRKGSRTVFFGNGADSESDRKEIDIPYVPNRMVVSDRIAFGTVGAGEYLLVVGVNRRVHQYLLKIFQHERGDLLSGVIIVASMAMGIVLFFFRDILELTRAFRMRDRAGLERLQTSSTIEARIMSEGLKAYETELLELRTERKNLRDNMQQSLRTELDSGKSPPYQFDCVMVRTDINEYSMIYSTYPVEEFMKVINEFFTRASEVVARYGGYVTEFVGDEIIYYFKDEEHGNSASVAIAAVRDVHAIAEELDLKTREVNGYPFRVKSAVAPGSLRFGPQAHGLALSGSVFVETVRILSQIDDKSHNSLYFPERLRARIDPICGTEFRKAVELRGVPGRTNLHAATEFVSCESLLSCLTESTARLLRYFRSDRDLEASLRLARGLASPHIRIAIARSMRGMGAPSASPGVCETYAALLEQVVINASPSDGAEERRFQSTFVSLSTRLIAPSASRNDQLRQALTRCLSSSDTRTVANAVDAFICFEPSVRHPAIERMLNHADSRVAANALVKEGLVHLGEEVISGLRGLIRSSDPGKQASGAYAIGELARRYRTLDLPFFKTHLAFQALMGEMTGLARSNDLRVTRQVRRALLKAGVDLRLKLAPKRAA